jgi:hypothetical protein
MRKLIITEEEKEEILNKYDNTTDNKLLTHLKRHFPINVFSVEGFSRPFRRIQINGKEKSLDDNKKYLVNRIVDSVEDEFPNLDKNIMRRTIKYYIDISRTLDS